MPSAQSSRSSTDIIQVFKHKLKREWRQKAACGRDFVLIHRLKTWMNTREAEQQLTNAGRLLHAIYINHPQHHFQRADSKDIADHLLVFAILLQNDLGDLVHHFPAASIADATLSWPFIHFRGLLELDEAEVKHVTEIFDRDRWAFCPVEIENDMKKMNFDSSRIVPICRKKEINEKGGTAQVFQVLIQEDFISKELQDSIPHSRVPDGELGPCYQFALKTYQTIEFYNWETTAFLALRGQEGMVQCICSYSLSNHASRANGNVVVQDTHNILLEFGEFDLDEFFATSDPPAHPREIIGFWEKFFKIADALHQVHYPEIRNRDGHKESLHGWHADLKPDNILRVHGEFKLADFGFAKFQRRHHEDPTEYIEGGTQTFGAPEFDRARRARGTKTPVLQTIDMWSLGCVLSVAVTWVVLGFQGVWQYERLRRTAIAQLKEQHKRDPSVSAPEADDAFHDGKEVLPEVIDWFGYLRHAFRRSDFVSDKILKLVCNSMLLSDPRRRINSPDLCNELKDILILGVHKLEDEEKSGKVSKINPAILEILQDDIHDKLDDGSVAFAIGSETLAKGSTARKAAHLTIGNVRSIQANQPPDSTGQEAKGAGKKIGKTQLIDKAPVLKTAHRAVQHSRAFPKITKRSTGTSSASNPTIADKTSITESPTGVSSPQREMPVRDEDIPDLTPKAKRIPNGALLDDSIQPQPNVVVTKADKLPVSVTKATSSPVRASSKAPYYPENPQAATSSTAFTQDFPNVSAVIDWPLNDPYWADIGNRNCAILRTRSPWQDLEIFRVGEALNTGSTGGKFKKLFTRAKKDKYLQNFIKDRDIILVFDNAVTMKEHWTIARYTAETLVRKVASLDDDGLDYVFTTGRNHAFWNVKGESAGPTIRDAMNATPPDLDPTNMEYTLSIVFDKYINAGERKQTTLLIFTDGVWAGTKDRTAVEQLIQRFSKTAKDRFQKRWFSIEFISFGQDANALGHLQYLDDHFCRDYEVDDIIDTEPWSGSVNKMILGSFEEEKFDDSEASTPLSPPVQELSTFPPSRTGTSATETPKRRSFLHR